MISVVGNVGSGKSFLINWLEEELKKLNISYKTIQEPVDLWINPFNFLKETENNTAMKPISQGYIFATLMNALQPLKNFNGVIIMERGVMNGIHEFSFEITNPLVRHFYYELGKLERELGVDLIINLNTSLKSCNERVVLRNRKGELESVAVNEYLSSIDMRHRDYIKMVEYLAPEKLISVNEGYDIKPIITTILSHTYSYLYESDDSETSDSTLDTILSSEDCDGCNDCDDDGLTDDSDHCPNDNLSDYSDEFFVGEPGVRKTLVSETVVSETGVSDIPLLDSTVENKLVKSSTIENNLSSSY